MRTKGIAFLYCFAAFFLLRVDGQGATHGPMVTDVSPRSFSVVWCSAGNSTGTLNLFLDEDGSRPLADPLLTFQPTIDPNSRAGILAAKKGILKVRVSGLLPATSYFFQAVTVSDSGETSLYPGSPPYLPAKTEAEVTRSEGFIPFSNDLVALETYLPGTILPPSEGLVVAMVEGSAHPISAFIGDSVNPPWALLDLNNLFSHEEAGTLALSGGEILTVYSLTGNGLLLGDLFRVVDSSNLVSVTEDLPIFGDFTGPYGLELADAVTGLGVLTIVGTEMKEIQGIVPVPRRGVGEVIHVLTRLSAPTWP